MTREQELVQMVRDFAMRTHAQRGRNDAAPCRPVTDMTPNPKEAPMSDLTPEKLAELQRLQDEHLKAMGYHDVTESWFGLARAAIKALPALLDAAAERDALRRRLVAVEMLVEDALRHGYDLDPQEIASALGCALDATPTGGES